MNYLLDHWTTVAVMALCAVGSLALFLNEILHSPDCPNYRGAPWWVRAPMFCWGAALAYRAVTLFTGLRDWHPEEIGWTAPLSSVFMAVCLVAFLVDTARGRLSGKTWRMLERLHRLARCKPASRGAALLHLATHGAIVVAPGDRGVAAEAIRGVRDPI